MIAHQLTIAAKNQPGILAKVTSIISREKINMRAISISSFGGHGFFNIIVDDPVSAQKALREEGLKVELKEVIAVLIEDRPGGLDRLVQIIAAEGINVENAYGFVIESKKMAVFVFDVDSLEKTQDLLKSKGFKTLDAASLNAIDPHCYTRD
jgi:hypothetical protein